MPALLTTTADTRHLPRILCLHGGGVNAAIFKAQSRSLIRHLQHSFRLVWADGPFLCEPHPDVVTVYGSWAPFRRWQRWLSQHSEVDDESCIEEIGFAMKMAMEDDDLEGGTGEWVGLMGFSQGAKMSASLLLEQQARETKARQEHRKVEVGLTGIPDVHWRFGILLAGRAPINNLNPTIMTSKSLIGVGQIAETFELGKTVDKDAIVSLPTLHVHGLADPGLHLHQILLNGYCAPGSTTLVEWPGAHRIPIKTADVEPIIQAIYDIAEGTGVDVTRTV